jgi:hypothetical protein
MIKKYKLVFTVPIADAEKVRAAIGNAGAGKYPNYSFCSFSSRGIGRFRPEASANPAIGEVGKLEEVEEERVECQIDEKMVDDVLRALRQSHPYEEIAYDLFPLEARDI